jgi:ADP-ribose pyrophosphatase
MREANQNGQGPPAAAPIARKQDTIWHGGAFDFVCAQESLPNGRKSRYGFIQHPGSAAIVPLFEDESVVLIHQWRPPIKRSIWEIPAGTLLPGEDPLTCARRELEEECGLRGDRFEKIGEVLIAPWYSDEQIHLYLATGLRSCPSRLDEDELLTSHRFSFDQVLSMIERGEIEDATAILALTRVYRKLRGEVF